MYKNKIDYIQQLFAPETNKIKEIKTTLTNKNDQISIYPEEGKFLQFLIQISNTKTIIEIGTLGSYSTHWMLESLPKDGHIYTFERDEERAEISKNNIKDPRITFIQGDATKELTSIEEKAPFDMIFIDADKINYLHYLDWAEKNIRTGGLIIGDNTLLFNAVWQKELPKRVRQTTVEIMRTFNKRLSNPEKYTSILLPTEEGMTIAIKNF